MAIATFNFDTLTKARNYLTLMGLKENCTNETPTAYTEYWAFLDGTDVHCTNDPQCYSAKIHAVNDGFGKHHYTVEDYTDLRKA
jgi:hypothetical protein